MAGSFDKIDYSLRPAKYAERRMIRDIFRRSAPFGPAEDATYIGFGSVWFADFILFHRSLGIASMLSIESSTKAMARVTDNAPFRIDLKFERASRTLKTIDWEKRHYVWLDYDDQITTEKLQDSRQIAAKAASGTILAITVRSARAREFDQTQANTAMEGLDAIGRFRENFQSYQIPDGVFEDDLVGKPFSRLSRRMLINEIDAALAVRNRRIEDAFRFHHICSFEYADGVEMTTIIGIFHLESEADKIDQCGFDTLGLFSNEEKLVEIEVPLLTPKEFRHLEKQLPLKPETAIDLGSIPEDHAETFIKYYRYLPNYVVLEN